MIYLFLLLTITVLGFVFSFNANAQPNPSNTRLWTTNATTSDTNVMKIPTGGLLDSIFNKVGSTYNLSGLNSVRQWYPVWLISGLQDTLSQFVRVAGLATAITTALGFTPYNGTANPNGFLTTASLTTTTATVTRPINGTTFTPSATKQAFVKYNIKITCTASIGSASTGKVAFLYSTDGGTTWVDAGEVENSNTVSLAVVLNSVTTQSGFIVADIPAGALCRMNSTSAGTTTITYIRGFETY